MLKLLRRRSAVFFVNFEHVITGWVFRSRVSNKRKKVYKIYIQSKLKHDKNVNNCYNFVLLDSYS